MTHPHDPSSPSTPGPPPGPSPGVMALLWVVMLAGFALGGALVVMGLVGWAQGLSAGTGLGVALAGVLLVLGALWYLRLILTHRRARKDFDAARVELGDAIRRGRSSGPSGPGDGR